MILLIPFPPHLFLEGMKVVIVINMKNSCDYWSKNGLILLVDIKSICFFPTVVANTSNPKNKVDDISVDEPERKMSK